MVKFTQELTDTQPANAGSDCGSNSSSSSAAASVKAVSGGDVMSDEESAGLDGKHAFSFNGLCVGLANRRGRATVIRHMTEQPPALGWMSLRMSAPGGGVLH